jgi:PAS domain S-box-containing protein
MLKSRCKHRQKFIKFNSMTESREREAYVQNLKPPFLFATLVTVLGFGVLLGWIFEIQFLKQPLAGFSAMNPITALSFAVFGITLIIVSRKIRASQGIVFSLYFLAALPIILILTNVFGFEIDARLFFDKTTGEDMRPLMLPPMTMWPIGLISVAIMLTISGRPDQRLIANVLVGISFMIALFAVIGYSYNVSEFGNFKIHPMAVHSAVGFILTQLSILLINRNVGFMKEVMSSNSGGTIARALIPMLLIFAVLIGYARLIIELEFPISIELGVSVLLTFFVSLFVVIALYVAKRLNSDDSNRRAAELKLEKIATDLEQEVIVKREEFDQTERRYRALIDQSSDGIALNDANNQLLFQSPAGERITGYTFDERKKVLAADIIHPDDIPNVQSTMATIRAKPFSSAKYQWRVRHKDGHYFWVEGVATNLLEDPNIRAILNNYRDITERKEQEEKLAASERRFRVLIENSADAIALTDEKLITYYQSPSVERMTGFSLEHRRQYPNARYTHPDDIPVLQIQIEKAKKEPGKPIPFTSRLMHKYGHVIWIEGVITNLLNDSSVGALVFNYRDVTERRQLEEQQALFTSLVNSSSDAILSKNLEGIITSWNRGAQLLFGYTASEAVGENIMILVPPDLRKEEVEIQSRIRRGETVDTFETRRIKKDGTIAYITITASPIRNADGTVVGASNISHDISERIDNEARLRKERSMLRTLIDNIPDYIYVKDIDSHHIINNKAMVEFIGADTESETLGKSSKDFFGDEVAAGFLQEDKEILRSGKGMINFEESAITKNGNQKYLLTTKVPLTDDKNNVIGIVGISRDITHQKETELDLRTSKYFLERAQQVANVGHWTLQAGPASASKLFLSKEACRTFEIEPGSFDGKLQSFLAFVHPDDRHNVNKAMSLALVNQTPYSMDHRILLNDGIEKWVHVQTEVTPATETDAPMLLGIVQDITARKKIESEILSLNAGLEKKVSERTAQLEAVNKELEAFSYSVSHDLRAPLRIIDGFATILVEDATGLDERMMRNVKTIARNANRMSQLIDDLLNFSRLGRTQIKVADVDMRIIVEQVLEEFQSADMIKNTKIHVHDIESARGDSSLIKQVWVNLLSNAIKYSSKKENAIVEVGMVSNSRTPTWYVKDNGAGFSMEYSSKLFGVFQRLHKQDEFEGTGVGLALVQRIISRHGGNVWAESILNEGATFYFTLTE